jgi:hypothetical protein
MTDKYNTLRGAVAATLRMGAESRISIPGRTVQALLDERDALLAALHKATYELDCMIDYVGESSAINMVGGRDAYNEASQVLDEICAAIESATRGAE